MAHVNRVLRSIETDGGARCVDLFVRPDRTFGFEEYRRDVEDGRGWFPVGFYGARVYQTEDCAMDAALTSISWLSEAMTSK